MFLRIMNKSSVKRIHILSFVISNTEAFNHCITTFVLSPGNDDLDGAICVCLHISFSNCKSLCSSWWDYLHFDIRKICITTHLSLPPPLDKTPPKGDLRSSLSWAPLSSCCHVVFMVLNFSFKLRRYLFFDMPLFLFPCDTVWMVS